jgi:DNA-binding MarR family transcriptional regulator
MALLDEIQQTKPFSSLQEEVLLNLVRTSAAMMDELDELFRERGITNTQYNVLRILRGAEPDGLCRNELRDRMLTRMPDVTRLLDRMEAAGLVARSRDNEDRRLVSTRITPAARKVVDELDAPVRSYHKSRLAHMSDEQMRALVELLTRMRGRG